MVCPTVLKFSGFTNVLRELAAIWGVSGTATGSPGMCNGGGMTGCTMKDIKSWNCICEALHVLAKALVAGNTSISSHS